MKNYEWMSLHEISWMCTSTFEQRKLRNVTVQKLVKGIATAARWIEVGMFLVFHR